jgi:hypothetical protein
MRAAQELLKEMLANVEANQDKMMAKSDAHHGEITARTDSQLEKTKAMDLETAEKETAAEHPEVPKEEAVTFGALKERYGDRHLGVGRRQQLRKRTQGDDGSLKELVAARRGMIAVPFLHHGMATIVWDQAGQRCKRNLDRTEVLKEMSGTTGNTAME